MNAEDRDAYYDRVVEAVERGEMSWGQAVRGLRRDVAGMKQARFAGIANISVRTLRNLETDSGNPTLATLEAVLAPFGLRLGIRRQTSS